MATLSIAMPLPLPASLLPVASPVLPSLPAVPVRRPGRGRFAAKAHGHAGPQRQAAAAAPVTEVAPPASAVAAAPAPAPTSTWRDLPVLRDRRGTLLPTPGDGVLTANDVAESSGRGVQRSEPDAARLAEQERLHRLVAGCMRGDAAAWQQLVSTQHRRIYGICYRFTGSPTDAEDLTQEVFLKLYRSLPSFDLTKGSFHTWLTTLTRNLLVDHFRRTRLDRATDSLDETLSGDGEGATMADRLQDRRPGQQEQVAQMQLRARVQHALKQLSPELREAVILRDLQDMDYRDIASVLRIPEGTVKSRISRGRGELARILQRAEGQVM